MNTDRDCVAIGWVIDFIRAAIERPLWARLLFRLAVGRYAYREFIVAVGRYAYREFIGMIYALRKDGYYFDVGYDLEDGNWHKDHTPLDWRKAAWATPENLTQP